jgi:hypothetical protein
MGLFDNFKNLGEALQNFNKSKIDSDKDDIPDSEEKTSTEELADFLKAKEEYEPTEYQKQLGEMEDYKASEDMPIVSGQDILIEQSKQEKKEDELDKKIQNIQKILKEFGDDQAPTVTNIPDILSIADTADKMNIQPIDMGTVRQKELMAQLPKLSSEKDRIELLYQDLIKRNLI